MSLIERLLIASPTAVIGLLLCACDSPPPPHQDAAETSSEVVQTRGNFVEDEYCGDPQAPMNDSDLTAATPSGDYTVRILNLPQPVPSNQIFALTVEVMPTAELLGQTFSIRADAGMPHHGHGLVVNPKVQPQPEQSGRFEIRGMMLHMPGNWEFYIDIFDGPFSERVIFHVLAR